MTHRPEDAQPLPTEHRRRRRLLRALPGLLLLCLAAGLGAALLTTRHQHGTHVPSNPHHGHAVAQAIASVASLGIVVLVVPVVRAVRTAGGIGTPRERRDLARMGQQRRAEMVAAARRGEVDARRPDLQRVAVEKEYQRTRWMEVLAPLLTVMTAANAFARGPRMMQVLDAVMTMLLLGATLWMWRSVRTLRRFLRKVPARPVPPTGH